MGLDISNLRAGNQLQVRNLVLRRPSIEIAESVHFQLIRGDHEFSAFPVNGLTGESLNYQQSFARVENIAAALYQIGARNGDVLGLFLPNHIDYPLVHTGATSLGMITTTVNPTYKPSELSRQLIMSQTKILVTMKAFLPTVKEALAKIEGDQNVAVVVLNTTDHQSDVELSFDKLLQESHGGAFTTNYDSFDFENDVVSLPFSSGTTGVPKGVMLTHQNVVNNARQMIYSQDFNFLDLPTDSFQPSTLCVLPLFHIFGLNVTTFPTLHVGGKLVMLPSFDPKTFLEALEQYRPTFMHFAPPLVGFCANHPDVKPHHLESIESVFVGAAPVGKALSESFLRKAPHIAFREGFGMTELSPCATMTPGNRVVGGSCGTPVANTAMKVVDLTTGEDLPPLKQGEICVKGPQVMKGYLRNDIATESTIKNGWLHTGDIGYYDDNKFFYVVDRLKELIKVSGYQVPPAELENTIRSHPAVLDVAVIGIPDEKRGEVPRAYVVLRPNQNVTEEVIHEFVNEEVADYKRLLGGIEFMQVIPKSASGKILRKDLVAQYLARIPRIHASAYKCLSLSAAILRKLRSNNFSRELRDS
eukprot:maker-scaffold353_size198981-snap-gene-0.37 protein:Tk05252 transcript:maker-scaffold353_size198981-snap-gene-0.37-mRNA-1 annotation:"hypothetical protein CAPTEDRAFT_4190"